MIAQIVIEAAQDLLAAIDHDRLDAETVEDAGELDRDIAAADDANTPRQAFQMKGLVRGDGELAPLEVQRHERRSTGGDEHISGGDPASVRKGKGVTVLEDRPRHDELGPGAFEIADIGLVEPVDLLVLVGDEG